MKRKKIYVILASLCLITFFAIAISYARNGSIGSSHSNERTANAVRGGQVLAQATLGAFVSAPVTPGLFVASALPVTIAVGASNSDKGFSEIPLAINAKAASKVTNLNLVLFELGQTGKLLGAESINGAVDLTAKRSDNISIRVRRLAKSGSPVILALESVSGPDGSWQIDFSELLDAAVAVAGNKPIPAVNVSQKQDRRSVDYGSNHCARAFALASSLSKFGEGGGMSMFHCDQQTRDYSFSYASIGRTP